MGLSNENGWLVLSTGNKSEISVGYCTLYGDMVGGFSPIKDVYKTLVYRICNFVNRKYSYIEEEKDYHDIVKAGFDEKMARDVINMVDFNEYKRRQGAPGIKITQRA